MTQTNDGGATDLTTDALCASGQVQALEWKDDAPFFDDDPDSVIYSEAVGAGYTYIAEAVDCTLEEAKAAAQAEYERRILAALTPAPQPEAATPTEQEEVLGPRPAFLTCKGCPALVDEPSGDGETYDSGTSQDCKAASRHISTYGSPNPPVPEWCPHPHPPQPSETVAEAGEDLVRAMRLFWEADEAADECRAAGKDLEAARYDKMATGRWQSIPEKIDALDAALRALKGGDA